MDDLIDKNVLILDSIKNDTYNFKNLLKKSDCIIWTNCSKLNINIGSTINKLIFINCNNIKIKLNKIISGVDFDKCKNIKMKTQVNKSINYLSLYKTDLVMYINQIDLNQVIIDSDKSNLRYKLI